MTRLTLFVAVVTVVGGLLQQAAANVLHDEKLGYSYNTRLHWLSEMTAGSNEPHSRKKRFIGLPIGSNIEIKWSVNFPFDTFTFYRSKIQLALPIKVPFPQDLIVGGGVGARSLPATVEEKMDWHLRSRRNARKERMSIFKYLEAAIEKAGLDGRDCVLRTICDVAEAPFDQGLMGDLFNTMLTASTAGRPDHPSEGQEYDRYLEAELHGKLNGKCEFRYNKCKMSPFELFPEIMHKVF